jgi:PAS domain S-box-containing protein
LFAQLINRSKRGDASTDEPPALADAVTAPQGSATRARTDAASDDLLDAAIDWVDAPLTYFDSRLVLRAANAAYCRLVARQRHEVVGRPLDELLATEQRETIRSYFERALSGESLDVDIVHQSGGAIEGASRIEYRPHRDASGQIAGVFVILHRLGRRQADQAVFNPIGAPVLAANTVIPP